MVVFHRQAGCQFYTSGLRLLYTVGSVDAVYNDLPDAMMARVRQYPTLLWLPLTADQPVVVPDEQNPEAVGRFLAEHRTAADEVRVWIDKGDSESMVRPPRPLPLWQTLPANLASAMGGQHEKVDKTTSRSAAANDQRKKRQREEEAQAEQVFAEMDRRLATPTEATVAGKQENLQVGLKEATGAGPTGRLLRPGQWKVRMLWCLVFALVLILLIDCVHPLKPYINPDSDEDESSKEEQRKKEE